jgi:hypothetical protein
MVDLVTDEPLESGKYCRKNWRTVSTVALVMEEPLESRSSIGPMAALEDSALLAKLTSAS